MGGDHSIVANYSGSDDPNYNSADPSAALSQSVGRYTPNFTDGTTNSVYGHSITLTATLNGPANVPGPTGAVVFYDTYTDNSNNTSGPNTAVQHEQFDAGKRQQYSNVYSGAARVTGR